MSGLLAFHQLAALRGDGLHPRLREFFELRATLERPQSGVIDFGAFRPDLPVQAGPNPGPREPGFRPGNVVAFDPPQAAASAASPRKSIR